MSLIIIQVLNPDNAVGPSLSVSGSLAPMEEPLQRHLQNAGNPAGDDSRFVYNIRIISLSFPETMGAVWCDDLIVPLCFVCCVSTGDMSRFYLD